MTGPETFPGLRGHTAVAARLRRALRRDALHHAMIFVGPRGVGKARLASAVGMAMHCTEAPGVGCGVCSRCSRIRSGNHGGVQWVEPEGAAGRIKVDVARELANRLQLAPFEGDRHLVVIDPAESMTEQAQNALLKALEEPKPAVHFILVARNFHGILPTILSRCLVVRLGPLPDDQVAAILDEAQETIEPKRRELAVRLCGGSAGVATELALDPSLDHALQVVAQAIDAARRGPPAIFGGDGSELWTAWTEGIGGNAPGKAARERALAARVAELWLTHLRAALRGQPGLPGLPPQPEGLAAARRQADRVAMFYEGLERNPNVRLSLEETLLQLGG